MKFDADLPGADLVAAGIRDLRAGKLTIEALLVVVGAPRLTAAGIRNPPAGIASGTAELELYRRSCGSTPKTRTEDTTVS